MTADAYEAFNVSINYTDPQRVTEAISQEEAKDEDNQQDFGFLNLRRDALIFEIGQGPGILGKKLTERGYTNINGADISAHFNQRAQESGWYQSVKEMWFGRGVDQLPADMIGKFDLVMATGVFVDAHLPDIGFDEAHALLKTGGHFITSIRQHYFQDGHQLGYKEKIESLVAQGKWEIRKTWTFQRGIPNAIEPLFKKMTVFMFICRRLD